MTIIIIIIIITIIIQNNFLYKIEITVDITMKNNKNVLHIFGVPCVLPCFYFLIMFV